VANKGENINVYRILVGKTERYCLATQSTRGRIILKWILKTYNGTVQTGFIWQGNRDLWQAFVKTL